MTRPVAMTPTTAQRVKDVLAEHDGPDGTGSPHSRGRRVVMVRCTDDEAAGGSGAAADCYPAIILQPLSTADMPGEMEELGVCWLTVLDEADTPVEPTSGRDYIGILAGDFAVGTDVRRRAFAVVGGCGSVATETFEIRAADCSIKTVEVTGCGIEITVSPPPPPPPPPPTPALGVVFIGRPEPSGPYPEGTNVVFVVNVSGGTPNYDIEIEFGDGDDDSAAGVAATAYFAHVYTDAGIYYPRVNVSDSGAAVSGPVGVQNGNGNGYYEIVGDSGPVRRPTVSVLDADFDATTDTTLNDVTGTNADLTHELAPGTYQFQGELFCDLDATGGGKAAVAFGGTAGSILYELRAQDVVSRVWVAGGRHTASGSSTGFATPTVATIFISGTLVVTAVGVLSAQFSQNTSSGTSSVLAGSWFSVAPAEFW